MLLFTACDAVVPPITVRNATSDDVSVSFYYKETARTLRIKEQDVGLFSDSLTIASGETPTILFAAVERDQYTMVVKDSDGKELFLRTFLEEELDERDWKITITPEGIR